MKDTTKPMSSGCIFSDSGASRCHALALSPPDTTDKARDRECGNN